MSRVKMASNQIRPRVEGTRRRRTAVWFKTHSLEARAGGRRNSINHLSFFSFRNFERLPSSPHPFFIICPLLVDTSSPRAAIVLVFDANSRGNQCWILEGIEKVVHSCLKTATAAINLGDTYQLRGGISNKGKDLVGDIYYLRFMVWNPKSSNWQAIFTTTYLHYPRCLSANVKN